MMLPLLLLIVVAGQAAQPEDSPREVVYRSANRWMACANDIAKGIVTQHPDWARTPMVVAESAVDACKDERAAFHALAIVMVRYEAPTENADALAAETEARVRASMITQMTDAQGK